MSVTNMMLLQHSLMHLAKEIPSISNSLMALQMELRVSVDLIAPFTVSAKHLCGGLKLFVRLLSNTVLNQWLLTCVCSKTIVSRLFLFYVDDVLVAASNIDKIHEIEAILAFHYKLKEFGEVQEFLGILIVRNLKKRQIFLH
jgi:Reverse transcriptase (RNA-dependent DNA polymerase)